MQSGNRKQRPNWLGSKYNVFYKQLSNSLRVGPSQASPPSTRYASNSNRVQICTTIASGGLA